MRMRVADCRTRAPLTKKALGFMTSVRIAFPGPPTAPRMAERRGKAVSSRSRHGASDRRVLWVRSQPRRNSPTQCPHQKRRNEQSDGSARRLLLTALPYFVSISHPRAAPATSDCAPHPERPLWPFETQQPERAIVIRSRPSGSQPRLRPGTLVDLSINRQLQW